MNAGKAFHLTTQRNTPAFVKLKMQPNAAVDEAVKDTVCFGLNPDGVKGFPFNCRIAAQKLNAVTGYIKAAVFMNGVIHAASASLKPFRFCSYCIGYRPDLYMAFHNKKVAFSNIMW